MRLDVKRAFAFTATLAALFFGGSGVAVAAHDSQAHDQHERLAEQNNPGWQQMQDNPSTMEGMMNSPPMHGAEHPGPDNQPDVVEEGPSNN